MANVELTVRSRLQVIAEDLKTIAKESAGSTDELRTYSEKVGETQKRTIQQTSSHLSGLRRMTGRVASRMAEDFKAMMSAVGITEGLRIGGAFRKSVTDTVALSDSIRKLGTIFGMSERSFATFQARLTQGLGEVGLGAEEAVSALSGLSRTQVRGPEAITEYARTAGQLASLSGTKGQEGAITEGIARVITARGGNVQDMTQMRQVADSLRKAFNATGAAPSQILTSLEAVIARMPTDLRESINTSGLVQLGAVAQVAGPGATAFLEEFLGKSPIARKALEARGFGDVFGAEGLNVEAFQKAAESVMNMFPDDPRMMAQTLGLSQEGAEGFVRLYESLDRVATAQKRMQQDNRALESQYRSSMGAAEAFRASLNRVKSSLAEPLAAATQGATSALQQASETTAGATGVVAGAGLLATLLTGGGIRAISGLGRGKAMGLAEREAFETISGRAVQDVYVVNSREIGMAVQTKDTASLLTGLKNAAPAIATFLGKAGLVGAAGAAGYGTGMLINSALEGTVAGQALDDILEPVFQEMTTTRKRKPKERAPGSDRPAFLDTLGTPGFAETYNERNQSAFKLQPTAPPKTQRQDVRVRVDVNTKSRDLEATARPSRGGTQ